MSESRSSISHNRGIDSKPEVILYIEIFIFISIGAIFFIIISESIGVIFRLRFHVYVFSVKAY